MVIETESVSLRTGSAAEWAASTLILDIGEMGYDRTNGVLKFGNGVSLFGALPAFTSGPSPETSGPWSYDTHATSLAGQPGLGGVAWDNATQVLSGTLRFSHRTLDGIDIEHWLVDVVQGSHIYLQDAALHTNYQRWIVSGAPSLVTGDGANYWVYPVTLEASGGTGSTNFGNNLDLIALFHIHAI